MPDTTEVLHTDGLTRSALIDVIEERLTAVYHCTRVWSAWQVGTMTEDDFAEARGTDLAPDIADAVLALSAQAGALQMEGWLPTAENINALPQPIRDYIHGLVANCDPAGMVRENTMLRDTNAGLQKMYRAAADALDTPGNREPASRYMGYKGEPLDAGASEDQRAAWEEGHLAATQPNAAPAAEVVAMELRGIAETLENKDGCWRSCSGCHELNEGHNTGPYSAVLKCCLGSGCSECGGIGAVWDTTDYADMAAFSLAAPAAAIDAREQDLTETKALAESEGSRAVKYLRIIRKVRAVVDEWPKVDMPGSPLSRIRTIVAFAGTSSASRSQPPAARPNAAGQEQGAGDVMFRNVDGKDNAALYADQYAGMDGTPYPTAAPPLEAVGSSGMNADHAQGDK